MPANITISFLYSQLQHYIMQKCNHQMKDPVVIACS